ncbi:hypothetical protein F4604DRAFT_1922658 [Suillus subluteus]|nr:hypothetical protein F4604DRAFT_1922658 [Suillus subluteus]
MPPHLSATPSEIAARKWNTKKKAQASQMSAGEKTGNTVTEEKPLQQSSKVKALERKVWNETTANTRKRAPTATALQSVPAAKLVRKTPAEKLDKADHLENIQVNGHGQSQGQSQSGNEKTCKPKSVTVSIEDNDSVSEYGDSDHDSEKSDDNMEVPEDDDLDLLSQEELIKEIPHFIPPHAARSASAQTSNVSKSWSSASSTWMASSSVSDVADESNSEMQFADKDCEESDTQAGQRSKSYHHEPSSTVTNLKPQPGKKKRSKLAEARQELERPRFAEPKLEDKALPTSKLDDTNSSEHPFTWPAFC